MADAVAHQFEDIAQQREAAGLGMWTFLATEVLFFGALFTGFTYYLTQHRAVFHEASQHLFPWVATLNTAVLLASSVLVALAVEAAKADARRRLARLLAGAAGLGALFLALKGYEYLLDVRGAVLPVARFEAGHFGDPARAALFFVFYWTMTGLHFVHVSIGVGVLAAVATLGRRGAATRSMVENVGLYWHFVDLVWLFLFPLLYLVP